MDIICPNCREPWDNDTLHEYAEEFGSTYGEVAKAYRTAGCGKAFVLWGVTCERTEDADLRFALADILGDDMDGYAATLEDFGL